VVKRRPAPHLTVASAPQILSPKRLRPTIEEHQQIEQLQQQQLQQQQQAFNQLHNLSTLPATTAPIIDSSFINQTALITSSLIQQQQQQQQQQQPATTAHLAHLAGLQPAPASSAQPQLISSPSSCVTTATLQTTNSLAGMDNSMALAPLGLSQSMDSVNTASNEEEVSDTILNEKHKKINIK
jgi:hypothetical protein